MVHVGDIGVILGGRSSTLKVELPKYLHVSNGIRVQVVHVGTTAPFISRQEEMTATSSTEMGGLRMGRRHVCKLSISCRYQLVDR